MRVKCGAYLVLPINGTQLKQFKSFPHLGSIASIYAGALEDVHTRIKKVNVAFVKLYPVLGNKSILLRTRNQLLNTNGKSIILYGCGTQTITEPITNSLPVFVN